MFYNEEIKNKLNDNDIYKSYLVNEYLSVRGISYFDKFSKNQERDFYCWIKNFIMIKHSYRQVLEYLGVPYRKSCSIEYGKGIYDTIILPNDNASIITPYTSTFVSENYKNVIYGDIKSLLVCNDLFDLFILTNPQDEVISNFNNLESLSNVNIAIGVYGSERDKDREKKLEMIEKLKKNILCNYTYEYLKFDGYYFSLIVTKNDEHKIMKRFKNT